MKNISPHKKKKKKKSTQYEDLKPKNPKAWPC